MGFWDVFETVVQVAGIICDTLLIVLLVRQLKGKK